MTPPIEIISVDAIHARVVDHDWRFPRDNADRIDAHWRRRLAERPAMFDGRVLLMSEFRVTDSGERRVLESAHFETSFAAFLSWCDFGFPVDEPTANKSARNVYNCFSMAALSGNDGAFVLAEMGAHTSNAGQIYFSSGTPDLDDVNGDRLNFDGSVLRELEEETGLSPSEVQLDAGWTIVVAGSKIACMKPMKIDAPADEIARDLNARIATQRDPELAGMRVVRGTRDIDRSRMPSFIVAYLEHMFDQS
jgi:hypothetical protein